MLGKLEETGQKGNGFLQGSIMIITKLVWREVSMRGVERKVKIWQVKSLQVLMRLKKCLHVILQQGG